MLEPLDAYNLGRYLRERGAGVDNIEDVYGQHAHPSLLHDAYPIFLLNTQGEDQSCIFLKEGKCSIYEGRPRVCRLYPFTVKGGDRGRRFMYYQCLDSRASHFGAAKSRLGTGCTAILPKTPKTSWKWRRQCSRSLGCC